MDLSDDSDMILQPKYTVNIISIETLGGNNNREALQCLLRREQTKLSTVKVNLYDMLSCCYRIDDGLEKQKPITFVRPTMPLAPADLKAWKGLLSSIFQVKSDSLVVGDNVSSTDIPP
ncbi:hypothetical protein DPMN_045425 [Dreissena polymorpha]|uniref:Uncharacterized protein n=1 Tax=Dreissena polymorpha TaxID=45954 RepID=A0A9D4D4V5_DREPO|nr:hypothetical protein DPMN_045425 [Dreissena polymorpha]